MFGVSYRCCLMHDKCNGQLHSWNLQTLCSVKISSCQLLLSALKSATSPSLFVFPWIFPLAHLISIAGSLGRALISFSLGAGPHVAYKISANHEDDPRQNPLAGECGKSTLRWGDAYLKTLWVGSRLPEILHKEWWLLGLIFLVVLMLRSIGQAISGRFHLAPTPHPPPPKKRETKPIISPEHPTSNCPAHSALTWNLWPQSQLLCLFT